MTIFGLSVSDWANVAMIFIATYPVLLIGFGWITGVPKTLSQVRKIYAELSPNGGSSLCDAINRIERAVLLSTVQNQMMVRFLCAPMFHADAEGNWTWVSDGVASAVDTDSAHLHGSGWKTLVASSDRATVGSEWSAAVEEQRPVVIKFGFHVPGRAVVSCKLHAEPVVNNKNELIAMVGSLMIEAPPSVS